MKKIGNKGYMLVEIIICTVIVMAIAYFLMEMVVNFQRKNERLSKEIKYINDKSLMTKAIMDDVTKYEIKKVASCSYGTHCIDLTYVTSTGDVIKRLSITKATISKLEYGLVSGSAILTTDINYYYKEFASDLVIGTITFQNSVKAIIGAKKDSFVEIKVPATNKYVNGDYGINIIIPYTST